MNYFKFYAVFALCLVALFACERNFTRDKSWSEFAGTYICECNEQISYANTEAWSAQIQIEVPDGEMNLVEWLSFDSSGTAFRMAFEYSEGRRGPIQFRNSETYGSTLTFSEDGENISYFRALGTDADNYHIRCTGNRIP